MLCPHLFGVHCDHGNHCVGLTLGSLVAGILLHSQSIVAFVGGDMFVLLLEISSEDKMFEVNVDNLFLPYTFNLLYF